MLAIEACTTQETPSDPTPPPTPACPSDLPAACPSTPPSFSNRVEGIIESRCWACHGDGGVAQKGNDLSTYGDIFRQRSAVLNQVYSCNMPPSDAGALTADERKAMLEWLVCRAPEN